MAQYTIELHRVIEIRGGEDKIGLNEYPVYDDAARNRINKKIVDRFYDREIAHESIPMFIGRLKRKLNEIMPYYNQLYVSELKSIDPLRTIDVSSVGENDSEQTNTRNVDGTSNRNVTGSNEKNADTNSETATLSSGRNVQHAFPQQALNKNKDYATAAVDTSSRGEAKAVGKEKVTGVNAEQTTGTNSEESESKAIEAGRRNSTTTGIQGSQADLIMRWRAIFMNVDLLILDDLEVLFMSVWDSGDSNTSSRNGYLY